MKLLIVDELPVFIDGMGQALVQYLPGLQFLGAKNPETLWPTLTQNNIAAVLLDGDMKSAHGVILIYR